MTGITGNAHADHKIGQLSIVFEMRSPGQIFLAFSGIIKIITSISNFSAMSRLLIQQYYSEVDKIIQFGGSKKETSLRVAFQNLLNEYCKTRDFLLIPELDYRNKSGKLVYPDGTVKDALRLDWGYWESKENLKRISS